MNVEIDNYATAPKPTTLKIALESLMAIRIEPVLKAKDDIYGVIFKVQII